MTQSTEERREYPSVAEVMARRGKDRITMHPNALHEVADIAEAIGGCKEGVEWGRSHSLKDVPTEMPQGWAVWIVEVMGEFLAPDVRAPFLELATRDNPVLAAWWWSRGGYLARDEYDLLRGRLSARIEAQVRSGTMRRADEGRV